jgi:hypothetical protein
VATQYTPEQVAQALEVCPHLSSPAALAKADTAGKYVVAPHIKRINRELMDAWATPDARLAVNVPFQHGKSVLCSQYFPAWVLLMWPETRIALASYEETFAATFGGKVRDLVEKFGPASGLRIKDDTNAKGEWVIDGHGGGMVCKGRGGALTGRPADLLILDDLIKNADEAMSPTILDSIWDWYCTVAYSRLGPRAPIIGVGTRWCPKDLFGRWEQEAKIGGDKFRTIVFKAIAEKDDVLGRTPGQALWPERVPLHRLETIRRTRPRWFRACWQGDPQESSGLHFQPKKWPRFSDVGDAWRAVVGINWYHYRKVECTIVLALDWAQKGKKDSDHTAFVVAAFTPDGKVLVLSVFNQRLRYEENGPALARWCGVWHPDVVASDDDMLSDAMAVECRRYAQIPEIKRVGIKSKSKLVRAQAGIIRSQNNMFLVADDAQKQEWYEEMCERLESFTGADGEEDDIPDCFGILGRLADEFKPGEVAEDFEPVYTVGYGSHLPVGYGGPI